MNGDLDDLLDRGERARQWLLGIHRAATNAVGRLRDDPFDPVGGR